MTDLQRVRLGGLAGTGGSSVVGSREEVRPSLLPEVEGGCEGTEGIGRAASVSSSPRTPRVREREREREGRTLFRPCCCLTSTPRPLPEMNGLPYGYPPPQLHHQQQHPPPLPQSAWSTAAPGASTHQPGPPQPSSFPPRDPAPKPAAAVKGKAPKRAQPPAPTTTTAATSEGGSEPEKKKRKRTGFACRASLTCLHAALADR